MSITQCCHCRPYPSAFCQHSTASYSTDKHRLRRYRSFAVSGPSVWNSLPTALRMSDCSLTTFRTQLKALLFIWYIVYRLLHFLTAGQRICGLLEEILRVSNSLNNNNNNNNNSPLRPSPDPPLGRAWLHVDAMIMMMMRHAWSQSCYWSNSNSANIIIITSSSSSSSSSSSGSVCVRVQVPCLGMASTSCPPLSDGWVTAHNAIHHRSCHLIQIWSPFAGLQPTAITARNGKGRVGPVRWSCTIVRSLSFTVHRKSSEHIITAICIAILLNSVHYILRPSDGRDGQKDGQTDIFLANAAQRLTKSHGQ